MNFPNLARHDPNTATIDEITAITEAELIEAGIEASKMPFPANAEVPSKIIGSLSMWSFIRAWRYWVAEGPGLPVDVAERLHSVYGQEVRVDGHCGCPSPREWFKGFGVGSYHIDTQRGLNALAAALRSVYDFRLDPDSSPRTGLPLEEYRRRQNALEVPDGK